ncbi:Small nuclear ribonucleoprotein family protein [Hibiscus syriacus]|uniref:Small nuclear ribonucleoprotein family protein n=1 Tax=Hibiscus syriacus TaxID=106335 RepID=A0A6A2ZKF8_HIBSY|nr:Small nuclear ribonucleoprotein family protein [Hibiscus syriacus]
MVSYSYGRGGRHDGPATHALTFVWNGHNEDVSLVGDFTGNWKDPIKATHKGGARCEVEIRLPQGNPPTFILAVRLPPSVVHRLPSVVHRHTPSSVRRLSMISTEFHLSSGSRSICWILFFTYTLLSSPAVTAFTFAGRATKIVSSSLWGFIFNSYFSHVGCWNPPSLQQRSTVQAPSPSAAAPSPSSHPSHHDEVRIIFIMGLPEDVKERELQNLLRWLPGFEDSQLSYKGDKPKGFALFSNAKFAVVAKDALQKMVFDAKLKSLLHIEMEMKNLVFKRGLITDSDAFDKYGRFHVPLVQPLPNPASVASPSIHVPVKTGCCVEKTAVDGVHEGTMESSTKVCSNDKSGCYTLFVDNLPEKIHWKRLGSLFRSHGRVLDAFIPNKRNSKGVLFGFIRFASIEEAKRATSKMNGSYIEGSKIGVSFAKFKPRHSYWRKPSTGVLCKSGMEDDSSKNHYKVEGVIDEEKLQGAPFRAWNWDTFKNIADSWGQLLAIDESCQSPSSFDRAKIQVLAKAGARIDATLELKVGDNSFKIMVHEIEPSFKPNSWAPEEDESH